MGAGGHGLIAQVAETAKFDLHHPGSEAFGNGGRIILAMGIGNHDLVSPKHRLDS
jgi:hypothetical protein